MTLYEALMAELGRDWRLEFPLLAGAVDRIEASEAEASEASDLPRDHRQYEPPVLSCQGGICCTSLADEVAALIEREVRI